MIKKVVNDRSFTVKSRAQQDELGRKMRERAIKLQTPPKTIKPSPKSELNAWLKSLRRKERGLDEARVMKRFEVVLAQKKAVPDKHSYVSGKNQKTNDNFSHADVKELDNYKPANKEFGYFKQQRVLQMKKQLKDLQRRKMKVVESRMDDIKQYYNVKHVPIKQINKVTPNQNAERVEHYRQQLRSGEHIDPIQVYHDKKHVHGKGRYTLTDGHHRLTAHEQEGHTTVPVAFPKPKLKKYGSHNIKNWNIVHRAVGDKIDERIDAQFTKHGGVTSNPSKSALAGIMSRLAKSGNRNEMGDDGAELRYVVRGKTAHVAPSSTHTHQDIANHAGYHDFAHRDDDSGTYTAGFVLPHNVKAIARHSTGLAGWAWARHARQQKRYAHLLARHSSKRSDESLVPAIHDKATNKTIKGHVGQIHNDLLRKVIKDYKSHKDGSWERGFYHKEHKRFMTRQEAGGIDSTDLMNPTQKKLAYQRAAKHVNEIQVVSGAKDMKPAGPEETAPFQSVLVHKLMHHRNNKPSKPPVQRWCNHCKHFHVAGEKKKK